METKVESKNKFVIDGELTSFEPHNGHYGDYAIVKWSHKKQDFSGMATGDSVGKLKTIVADAANRNQVAKVVFVGELTMKPGRNGGAWLNLKINDVKET